MPDIKVVELAPSARFIVLGCDGLWDKMDANRAINLCRDARRHNKTPAEAAEVLTRESLREGSLDNVTCIVVYIDWPSVNGR